MSGHSKWSNIKRKKEIQDKQKGKVFGKLSRLITLAVIEGGGKTNPDSNVKLRLVIDKAKQSNMPKDNIERAIDKGTGPNNQLIKEVVYEAFGLHGVALLIETTTDNHNRTTAEIRSLLERKGGKLGNQGSVSYLFEKCGSVILPKATNKEEVVFIFAEKVSAIDINEDEAYYQVFFPYEFLGKLKDYSINLDIESSEVDYRPKIKVEIKAGEQANKIIELIEALEDLNDVHKVSANFTIINS